MRTPAALLLALVLSACSSSGGGNAQSSTAATSSTQNATTAATQAAPAPAAAMTVALRDSVVTYQKAQAACTGALGTLTFSLGHARGHAASGVTLQENPSATPGVTTMVFTDKAGGKTATVEVSGHARSVSGKNLSAKMNKSVACVGAE